MKRLTEILIKGYQSYSATREPRCKYYPSCSNYAATAIKRYGFKGVAISAWRLVRCNPWSHGGLDYVDYELDSAEALNSITSRVTTDSITSRTITSDEGVR